MTSQELPRLPVPPLQQTLDRFLRSLEPLLSPSELQTTRDLARDFGAPGGEGGRLQEVLEERAATRDNWLAEWWLNAAYLDFRKPLVINSNTGMAFPVRDFRSQSDQLAHAASYVASALDFKTMLDGRKLPTERLGPHPLDMSQHYQLFGTCRVPGDPRDFQRFAGPPESPAQHIVVAHNGHLFSVPVFGECGARLSEAQLRCQLEAVVSQSPRPAPHPLGVLTAEPRDVWASLHAALREIDQNRRSLDAIERAIFLLCLDGPPGPAELGAPNRESAAALKVMHGGGARGNSGNRWFDKCLQFIVGPCGAVGLGYEHSPAEGQPVTILMDFIEDRFGTPSGHPGAAKVTPPTLLTFDLPEVVREAIPIALDNIDRTAEDFEMKCIVFPDYGKEFIKTQNMSPDSYIQMALQLAFYRLHGEPGAQYESATTRRFLHGRTETIRSCSLQSVAFARTMLDPAACPRDKAGALRAAIQAHKEYVVQAMSGEGVDRHLLGLRLAAAELGLDVPPLFLDAGYLRSGHMRLSTSQVVMRCKAFIVFGPLVPDGYGVCYNPNPEEVMVAASAFRSCPDTSAAEFCRSLELTFREMRDALLASSDVTKP